VLEVWLQTVPHQRDWGPEQLVGAGCEALILNAVVIRAKQPFDKGTLFTYDRHFLIINIVSQIIFRFFLQDVAQFDCLSEQWRLLEFCSFVKLLSQCLLRLEINFDWGLIKFAPLANDDRLFNLRLCAIVVEYYAIREYQFAIFVLSRQVPHKSATDFASGFD
jgi:hypothetical protein